MAEIQGNNLYEINRQLSQSESIMGAAVRKKKQEELRLWFRDGIDTYAMLLCHDRRDFTLFRVIESPADAAGILFECLDNRGQVVSIDKTEDDKAWEIWIRVEDEKDYCYYLFCYDLAVIEV